MKIWSIINAIWLVVVYVSFIAADMMDAFSPSSMISLLFLIGSIALFVAQFKRFNHKPQERDEHDFEPIDSEINVTAHSYRGLRITTMVYGIVSTLITVAFCCLLYLAFRQMRFAMNFASTQEKWRIFSYFGFVIACGVSVILFSFIASKKR